MGHTMNKLTYECKKMQKLKALVVLQCKWERLDTPKNWPDSGGFGRQIIKSILKFLNFQKRTTCFSPKLNFGERHVVGFWKFKNFKNTFDYLTATYFCRQNLIFIFWPTILIHWSCETTRVLYVWKGFLPYFRMFSKLAHHKVHFVKL